jgi:hypothetical protein
MAIPTPIRKWIEQFTSARGFFQSSSEVDHDATSNRTHSGDDLSPATLEAETITDGADVSHTGELADLADVSPIQSSSDVVVTDTQVGTLADGEFLQNSGGSLAGAAVQGAFSNIQVFEADGTFDASNVSFALLVVVAVVQLRSLNGILVLVEAVVGTLPITSIYLELLQLLLLSVLAVLVVLMGAILAAQEEHQVLVPSYLQRVVEVQIILFRMK